MYLLNQLVIGLVNIWLTGSVLHQNINQKQIVKSDQLRRWIQHHMRSCDKEERLPQTYMHCFYI